MSTSSPLSEEERAELVAYLDGELDEEAARAIETKISLDPTIRAEVESLKRAWDLLDYLPRPEPSPSFTHRTLDRLSAVETRAWSKKRLRLRLLLGAGWVAAVLLAGLAGFFGIAYAVPDKPTEKDLVRDLRLIENLRFYKEVDSFEFLQELDKAGLFHEEQPSP